MRASPPTWLTARHNNALQEKRLAHQERLFFHQRRTEAYSAFTYAATRVWSPLALGLRPEIGPIDRFQQSAETIALIASDDTRTAVRRLGEHIMKKQSGPSAMPATSAERQTYVVLRADVTGAMRAELGIEEPTPSLLDLATPGGD